MQQQMMQQQQQQQQEEFMRQQMMLAEQERQRQEWLQVCGFTLVEEFAECSRLGVSTDAATTANDAAAAASPHGSANRLPIQQPFRAYGTAAHCHASYADSAAAARCPANTHAASADIYTACGAV